MKPYSGFLANMRSSDTEMYNEPGANTMVVEANPLAIATYCMNGEDEGESRVEPHVGLEFESADDARDFYNAYAMQAGFKIRIGQLYRSRVDGSIASRRFVCAKEGFQLHSRTGCPAFMRVKRLDSGKWVLDHFHKDHNHDLEPSGEICPPLYQGKYLSASKSLVDVYTRSGARSVDEEEEENGHPCPSGVINVKRLKMEEDEADQNVEPHVGLEFNSANEAYKLYLAFAANAGFKIRIGQLFRSKNDGSITSRRFVCSKEGHQHPSRVGCGAFMRIKRQDSGRWVVDRLQKEHNHDLGAPRGVNMKTPAALIDLEEVSGGPVSKRSRESSSIGNDWYNVLFEYFQSRQADDTGFFYAVDTDHGKCRSIFWADGRSRFLCSQFGDAIVFDTTYRRSTYLVPLVMFIGINHHKQPVLLGCSLVADESEESFAWLFRTYLKAMSGRRPVSIIADQDTAIEQAIAEVFPGIHHRFSMWQMKAKEEEYLGALMGTDFDYDYEQCIYQSHSATEFDSSWITFLEKYGLKNNNWLKEMYKRRKNWVPLFLRGTFFAGIPLRGSMTSYFGALLNAQTPLSEFVLRYEKGLERRREEERRADFTSSDSQLHLRTKEPLEDQCRMLYTITMFKVFQRELVDCYQYFGIKIYEEGIISKYLVKKCGNEDEQQTVTLNASNLNVNCSCQMFEYEGVLCRHVLRVFLIVNVRELPSRYILHRWTKNAEYGLLCDIESGGTSQDLKSLMLWSLREEAHNYIAAGATSLERYKLGLEIMREGRRNFCWHS